ncbi:zinc finger CCCH domain-containing protein 55-like [Durio zibethinus]|uniref:Zinc finger CCCH domain-containing protein 55-like n=1 Tax=Durio zibethinus TaxID=66656 RepID=A0A6P5ZNF5_DURZI|nr:zinc finger CCCH domain-containing protein 55-like [Durio zibethinus]
MDSYEPCFYFARGFCKNGDNCKLPHGVGIADNVPVNGASVGSPSKMDLPYHQHEDMMRMRAAAHHQRLAAALLMAGVSSPLPYEKNMNLLLQLQINAKRYVKDSPFVPTGPRSLEEGMWVWVITLVNYCYCTAFHSKQFGILDLFKGRSTIKPEVEYSLAQPINTSNMYNDGYPRLKLILARGNPHYIHDSRVLVKPYKEKGKVPGKRQHLRQQFERGNFCPCSSPSGLVPREPYDLCVGRQTNKHWFSQGWAKKFYNEPKMMLKRELEEQADLQQAIELQRSRFMNLQLPDFKNDGIHHHQRSLSVHASVSLPAYSHASQNVHPSDSIRQVVSEAAAVPSTMNAAEQEEVNSASVQKGGGNTQECSYRKVLHEGSVEHALSDSPSASHKSLLKIESLSFLLWQKQLKVLHWVLYFIL